MPRRSQQPGGQLPKNKHCRYANANIPGQAEPHKDESFSARQAKNPGKSAIYKHGRKRRVSESHESLHPVARKKRPKSEGELLMTKSVRASPSSELKSLTEERSLERVWLWYCITVCVHYFSKFYFSCVFYISYSWHIKFGMIILLLDRFLNAMSKSFISETTFYLFFAQHIQVMVSSLCIDSWVWNLNFFQVSR